MRPPFGAAILAVALFVTGLTASAQSRRVIDYFYDDAGNLVRIESSESLNPPDVLSITPNRIRIGPPVTVTAVGTDLRLVEVQAVDPTIAVTNVASTATSVTFDLQAASNTPLGLTDLVFTTRLGSVTRQVTIEPRLPVLFVSPAPVVVGVGQALTLEVELSNVDIADHTLSLASGDAAIATVSPASVTIPAGATRSSTQITISGVALGSTGLTIGSATLADFSTNVFVTDPFVPPIGENTAFAPALGVVKEPAPKPPVLVTQGPFPAALGVVKQAGAAAPGDFDSGLQAPLVGVAFGNGVEDIEPDTVIRGAGATALAVTGSGLDTVTAVDVVPADGVTVNAFSASADGQTATLTLTAAFGAALGQRTLVFNTSGAPLAAATAGGDRIRIAGGVPRVDSITPSVLTLASSATLVIRGAHFQNVTAVSVTPLNGVELGGPPAVNAAGTEVRIGVFVPETAALGDRVVTVTTGAGTSAAAPSSANKLTIVNGPVVTFENTVSPIVGVAKGEPQPPPVIVEPVISPAVGVTLGSVVTGIVPASGVIGTTVSVVIEGRGLENVSDVQFIPEDGLTVGPPVAAADGNSVSVEVAIAASAPQTLREVRLFDTGILVPSSGTAADRFRVTAPQPLLRSMSPNFVVTGDPAVELTLFGENFDDAFSVGVLPPDDLSIGPPLVSADGQSLTVSISAAATATAGDRVVVVTTPAGQTSTVATPANTLTVAGEIVRRVTPLVAPQVGVLKSTVTSPRQSNLLITAPLVGVDVTESPAPPASADSDLEANHLGVAIGPVAQTLTPASIPVDTSTVLVIQGSDLADVTGVEIVPPDGVFIDGPVVAVQDGTEVQVPISVSATAPLTVREAVLTSIAGRVPFSSRDGGRIKIAAGAPQILSIEPIQQVPGAVFTLTIRGSNLGDTFRVFAEPAAGVNFGSTITPNAGGTEITLDMSVDGDAALGPRVIRVDTPAGTTTATASSANTFNVVSP